MNLRKDHYRLLVPPDLQIPRKNPSGRAGPLKRVCLLGARARLPLLERRRPEGTDLTVGLLVATALFEVLYPFRLPPGGRVVGYLLNSSKSPRLETGFDLPMSGFCSRDLPLCEVSLHVADSLDLRSENEKTQHYTVDHLARGSMKNGANSVMPCELQDT